MQKFSFFEVPEVSIMTHAPPDNVLCVKVEQDLDQCNGDEKIINSGYLAYNVYGRFKILAIWSHGANNCLDAKKNSVGYFNRVDKIWKKKIDDRIKSGRCTDYTGAEERFLGPE